MGANNIAIIPARGGSKRVPRKNIRNFCGKPMIAWSIQAAREAGIFSRVIVSTDDEEIAGVARGYGADVPFVRPPELSHDRVATLPVVRHAIECLSSAGDPVDAVCCLYATAPFLRADYLREGRRLLGDEPEVDFVYALAQFEYPVLRAVLREDSGAVRMAWPEYEGARSQDLPTYYHDAGQFYWGRREAWLTCASILASRNRGVVLPTYLVQDIDTPDDWIRAESMFRNMQNG